ncbi:translation machinery-associated protein 16 [Friedmanniomyces endolithicus]|uniref:Translation machinery-associated protein 16 n=1 Tax=Friedmanniomyces endolithicus TaxID=329885 RepID=A0AAN6J399_9PEZI|nr:translation machinery-associated protein 16 [Friedmanniomyces endolithicus]KAK0279231.1 translation machinery-associated protein 16 [Friedmanniomyces endolithicus]KAK0311696.1 translation machinery-associated protein 16 [Friedmanniomyces endolithicus]KAK0984537.1 translation machinery-associated protein 16 [Friedmanniomyces endolithicus]
MPSKLSKVQKHVTKKKGSKINSLHENSRDAKRLRNAGARDDRVARLGAVREKANRQWLERVFFLQDRLPDTLHPLDIEAIQALITEFLKRNDEEIEQLKAERRVGRPPSTRSTMLEQEKKVEGKEYESGFRVPNLRDEETLTRLDGWKGDWISLANLRFLRIDAGGQVKESQFPPRDLAGRSVFEEDVNFKDAWNDTFTTCNKDPECGPRYCSVSATV